MKIRLKLHWEVEASEDTPKEVIQQAELLLARYCESQEAQVDQLIQKNGMGHCMTVNPGDEE